MATSITTQADVLTYGLISDNEIENLTTERMRANNWTTLHARAWTKILDLLALRSMPLTEDDIDDTDELVTATVYMVLHYAYSQAEGVGDINKERAQLYYDRSIKELQEVRLTIGGGTASRSSYSFRRARRM